MNEIKSIAKEIEEIILQADDQHDIVKSEFFFLAGVLLRKIKEYEEDKK